MSKSKTIKNIENKYKVLSGNFIPSYVDYKIRGEENVKVVDTIEDIECPHCRELIKVYSDGFTKGRRLGNCPKCNKDLMIEFEVTVIQLTKISLTKVKIG